MLRTDEAIIKALHAYAFNWRGRSRRVKPSTHEVNRNEYLIIEGERREGM